MKPFRYLRLETKSAKKEIRERNQKMPTELANINKAETIMYAEVTLVIQGKQQ